MQLITVGGSSIIVILSEVIPDDDSVAIVTAKAYRVTDGSSEIDIDELRSREQRALRLYVSPSETPASVALDAIASYVNYYYNGEGVAKIIFPFWKAEREGVCVYEFIAENDIMFMVKEHETIVRRADNSKLTIQLGYANTISEFWELIRFLE